MRTEVVSVPEDMDQEAVANVIAEHDLMAVPVVDAEGRMKGIVTVDDIVDVVREEATEDIQKIGGTQALDAPYLEVGVLEMVRKRAGWLTVLFVGEMLTATAMALLRGRDRARGGARALRPADHLERRQLGLAGDDARDPRDGARRGAAARLVARAAPRARRRASLLGADPRRRSACCASCSGRRAGRLYGEHFLLIGAHRRGQPGRRRAVGHARRLDAAVRAAPRSASTRRAPRRRSSRRSSTSRAS